MECKKKNFKNKSPSKQKNGFQFHQFIIQMQENFEMTLCRENWLDHPNFYSSNANGFISIHNKFKEEMKNIAQLCSKNKLSKSHQSFLDLKKILDLHHYVEEEKLFPFLKRVLKLTKENKKLLQDHTKMNEFLEEISKQFSLSKLENYRTGKVELLKITNEFREHMIQHLNDEEDVTIPAILLHGFKFGCCTSHRKTCCYRVN